MYNQQSILHLPIIVGEHCSRQTHRGWFPWLASTVGLSEQWVKGTQCIVQYAVSGASLTVAMWNWPVLRCAVSCDSRVITDWPNQPTTWTQEPMHWNSSTCFNVQGGPIGSVLDRLTFSRRFQPTHLHWTQMTRSLVSFFKSKNGQSNTQREHLSGQNGALNIKYVMAPEPHH